MTNETQSPQPVQRHSIPRDEWVARFKCRIVRAKREALQTTQAQP